jgi:hypothetical protein
MPDLTNLDDVKAWLAILTNGSDAILADLITSTSADFLRAIKRTDFLTANYTEVREGDGNSRIAVSHFPITAITEVKVGATVLAVSTDKIAAGFYFDADLDPERINQVYLAGGLVFTDAAQIVLAYSGGYTAVPGDVAQAVIEWVATRYKGRPGAGVASQREAGGEHVTYDREAPMPPATAACATRYMRDWPSLDKRGDDRDYKVTRINRTYTEAVK